MMLSVIERIRLGLWLHEGGQDLIEYALLVGLIAVVAVAALTTVGATVRDVFWSVISSTIGSL